MTRTPIISVPQPAEARARPRPNDDSEATDAGERAAPGRSVGPRTLPGARPGWCGRRGGPDAAAGYTQGALALSFPLPSGLESVPQARALTVVEPAEGPPEGPTVEGWAARLVQAVLEVLTGDRPLTQLIRWTDERVYAEIDQRLGVVQARRLGVAGRQGRQKVATVHVCQVSSDRAEVAARVTNGRRSRAVAARLERHRGRWVCTAIQFG
ncbi:MAG: Rv3235 family protein [Nocardioidaceae bacterium]